MEPSKLTLGDYLVGTWLPAKKVRLKATTLANYEHQLRSYVIPYLGAKPLQQINAAQLTAFYTGLLEDGRRQGDGGLSACSVHNVHAVLRKALQDAVKWNLTSRNPAASADTPSPSRKEMKAWTAEQLTTFPKAESATREHPLWRLVAMTGMRRGEVLGLPWSAVDLDAGRLSIVQTLVP